MDWRRFTSPTNSRVCRRLCRDGIFGRLRRPVLLCLAFSGRHSAVVHSLWQRLKHGTAKSHVTSSSSLASFKRNLKTELFLRLYVQAWYRLMLHVTFLTLLRAHVTFIIFVIIIIIIIIFILSNRVWMSPGFGDPPTTFCNRIKTLWLVSPAAKKQTGYQLWRKKINDKHTFKQVE